MNKTMKPQVFLALALTFSAIMTGTEVTATTHFQAIELLDAGKKLEALETVNTILQESSQSDVAHLASTRLLKARILTQLGEPIAAEDQLNMLLQSAENDHRLRLDVENEMGAINSQRGEYNAAVHHYVNARKLALSASLDRNSYHRILVNLCNALMDAGLGSELNLRLAEISGSLATGGVTDNDTLIATAALFRRAVQNFAQPANLRLTSSKLLKTALDQARLDSNDRQASLALGLSGALYFDEQRYASALQLTELALLYAQESNSLEIVFRWHSQIAAISLKMGNIKDSETAFESALQILSEIRRDLPADSPRLFSEQVLPVYNGYADVLLRQAAKETNPTTKNALLSAVVDNLENLKKAEVEDYFAKSCSVEQSIEQSDLLHNSAIVYPVFLSDRTEIVLQTSGGFHQFVINVGQKEITSLIRRFRLQLEDYENLSTDYLQTARLLERYLIDPIEGTLRSERVETLIFVPDGPLRTIPMAALFDGESFLIERYALASTPALSLTRSGNNSTMDAALIGGITEGVQGFSPLSFVGPELEQVSDILDHPKLKDQTFLLENIEKNFVEAQYSVVHFATHGTFSSDFRNSFILTYDDKLTMGRLESALAGQGDLDMLVLSACETAAGDDRAALGLAGVAIQAGAASALASLWSISDEGTAALIPEFYKHYHTNQLGKAESLRRAQVSLLRDERFAHPVYWAPYLLIGSWN